MGWGWYECVHHQNKFIIQSVYIYNNYKLITVKLKEVQLYYFITLMYRINFTCTWIKIL